MTGRLKALRDDSGYAMVAVLMVMFVGSLAAVAAVNATDFDLRQGAADKDRKRAYAAAEAGVHDYLARLTADVNYWQKCDDTSVAHIGDRWDGTGVDPRQWREIGDGPARYTVEVLPANGATDCVAGPGAAASFIDDTTGTFRIRATGEAKPGGEKRSVVASFRRRGFLDFVYFTDFETFPAEFGVTNQLIAGRPTRVSSTNPQSYVDWARLNCSKYYRDGRGLPANNWDGQAQNPDGSWSTLTDLTCTEIVFKHDSSGTDKQLGPFHTNDELAICGDGPWFGEKPTDNVEVSGPSPQGGTGGGSGNDKGWRPGPSCSADSKPVVNYPDTPASAINKDVGTFRKSSPTMTLPPSNQSVADEALPAYRFKGRTTIVMNGDTMTVTGKRGSQTLTNVTLPLPDDGVVAVDNDGVCGGLQVLNPLGSAATCGDLHVSGTYNKSLTLTAENDILIREDIRKATGSDHMLGLIAGEFVRVHHPVVNPDSYICGGNLPGPGDIMVEAAILAVNKSFTVDKYWCGGNLGTLSVRGAIAQQYRGTVGRGINGYTKDYVYDRRLRFRSPPKFLDPVESSWRLQSQVEQVPAT